MKGATEFNRIIQRANSRGIGGLKRTKQGYSNHGGDAECFRKDNVLYVTSSHARGETFFIYFIDENDALFKVYGIIDGNPGWTESYGWLHKGTWTKPILAYLRQLERDIAKYDADKAEAERVKQAQANRAIGEKVAKFNDFFREVSV